MASSSIIAQGRDQVAAAGNALSYFVGQCTRWVSENLSWVPAHWGNAWEWFGHAQAAGFQTIGPTLTPPTGAIAVWGPNLPGSGGSGHVAIVQGTSASGFLVSEENWLGQGITDVRNVTSSGNLLGFILPPNGFQIPPLPGVQGVLGAGQAVLGTGQAIAGLPAAVGHGIANAGTAVVHNAGVALRNWLVPLLVALVVAIVLFGGRG